MRARVAVVLFVGLLAPAVAGATPAPGARVTGARVTGAWARTTPPGARNGVVYLRVLSATTDHLVGVAVGAEVAAGAELHASMGGDGGTGGMANMPSMSGTGSSRTMQMRRLRSVRLPAGRMVVFEPGRRHVMLVGLARTLVRGDTFPLTLQLRHAGPVVVTVTVRDTAP